MFSARTCFSAHFKCISVFCKFHLVDIHYRLKCFLPCLCIYRAKRNWCVPRYLLGDSNRKSDLHKAHRQSTDHVHRMLLFIWRCLGHGLCSLPPQKHRYKYTTTQRKIWCSFVFLEFICKYDTSRYVLFLKIIADTKEVQTQKTKKAKQNSFLFPSRGLCHYV